MYRKHPPTTSLSFHFLQDAFCLFFFFFFAIPRGMWNFPDQGLNPCPLQWKRGVLSTGPPGKSPRCLLLKREQLYGCALAVCAHVLLTARLPLGHSGAQASGSGFILPPSPEDAAVTSCLLMLLTGSGCQSESCFLAVNVFSSLWKHLESSPCP